MASKSSTEPTKRQYRRCPGKPYVRCGNNYGWVRFEGSRCTEYSEDTYGSCADADISGYTFPVFEYCHFDYDSSLSSQDDYTNGNDICGDLSVVGNTVIGERAMKSMITSFRNKTCFIVLSARRAFEIGSYCCSIFGFEGQDFNHIICDFTSLTEDPLVCRLRRIRLQRASTR